MNQKPKRPLRLWTCFWGEKHLDLFERALVRSLSWPLNKDAIAHATWDIWTKESEFDLVADVAKSVGVNLELHAADPFLKLLDTAFLRDNGVMVLEMFKRSITRCLESGAQMLIAPPDTIFGGDSLPNMLQAAEQPGTVVFVAHIRVLPTAIPDLEGQVNRFGPMSSVSNSRLVKIAIKNMHRSFFEAAGGLERVNSFIGGIYWKLRPNGVISIQHHLPTPYVINWTNEDLAFFSRTNPPGQWPPVFGEIDHTWPATLFNGERARVLGSSDDAFICEVTDPEANVPPLMNYDSDTPDRFWRGAFHNKVLKQFCITLRSEE